MWCWLFHRKFHRFYGWDADFQRVSMICVKCRRRWSYYDKAGEL